MRLFGKVVKANLKSINQEFFDPNCEFKSAVLPVPATIANYGDGFAHTFGECSFGIAVGESIDCTIEVLDPAVLDENMLAFGQYSIELGFEVLESTLSHEGIRFRKVRIHCVKLIEAATAKWPGLGIVKKSA